jgi:S-adenosylmethionine uptake transporter
MRVPVSAVSPDASRTLTGVSLAAAAWAAFSLQDAIIKWLVAAIPVPEILFARSLAIVVVASFALRRAQFALLLKRRNLASIGVRAGFILAAWLTYYAAARSLSLPELVTLYFAAPLFVVALARVTLGEVPGLARWGATIVGFVGVVVAADLGGAPSAAPTLLVLFAALCWAMTTLLTRSLSLSISTSALMVGTNFVFVVACGLAAPFIFIWPNLFDFGLLLLLSLFGGVGQFFMFQGMRLAPASAVAPFEYSSLAWATLWGWLVFGDLPTRHILIGGAIILASGLFMLAIESRRRLAAARPECEPAPANFTATP